MSSGWRASQPCPQVRGGAPGWRRRRLPATVRPGRRPRAPLRSGRSSRDLARHTDGGKIPRPVGQALFNGGKLRCTKWAAVSGITRTVSPTSAASRSICGSSPRGRWPACQRVRSRIEQRGHERVRQNSPRSPGVPRLHGENGAQGADHLPHTGGPIEGSSVPLLDLGPIRVPRPRVNRPSESTCRSKPGGPTAPGCAGTRW